MIKMIEGAAMVKNRLTDQSIKHGKNHMQQINPSTLNAGHQPLIFGDGTVSLTTSAAIREDASGMPTSQKHSHVTS